MANPSRLRQPIGRARTERKVLAASIIILLLGLPSVFELQPIGSAAAAQSPGAAAYRVPYQVVLGNVSTSFTSLVYVPIYLVNGSKFSGLSQNFTFDSSMLAFKGVVDDVSSQNVTFTSRLVTTDILQVNGSGSFDVPCYNATLYYLEFEPTLASQSRTDVRLDATTIGSSTDLIQSVSTVVLAYGWTSLGPADIGSAEQAGTVPAMGFSPSYPNILYVASGRGGPGGLSAMRDVYGFGGLFRSNDSGATWYPVDLGLSSTQVDAIEVLPQDPNVVVIATGSVVGVAGIAGGGGIYKTINGGRTWQETFGSGGSSLYSYEGALYAATYHDILVSSDFGTTWRVVKSFPSIVDSVDVLSGGSVIVVGLYTAGHYGVTGSAQMLKSSDGGMSFFLAGSFTGYSSVSQILTNPSNQSQLWALIDHGYSTYPDLFRSQDSGASWQAVNDTEVGITFPVVYDPYGGTVGEAPQAMTVDPVNGSIIYVVGPSSGYKSTNDGKSFTEFPGVGDARMVTVDPGNDSVVYVGGDQGLYRSLDGGKTWSPLNNRSSNLVYSVIGQGQNLVTVEQDFGPISSTNFGASWAGGAVHGGEGGWAAVDPYNTSVSIVDSSHTNIVVSHDGGASFFTPAISNGSGFILQEYLANAPQIAFGSRAIYTAQQGGIYVSEDWGSTWSLVQGSPAGCVSIAVDPVQQDVLYASACTPGPFTSASAPNYGAGLLRSTDGGASWSEVNPQPFTSLAVDPANDSVVVGIVFPPPSTSARILLSADSGTTFTDLGFPSLDGFVAAPSVSFHESGGTSYMVYTNDEGVYVSANLGSTWQDWSYNMPAPVISSLQVNSNGSALVSTYGTGVWYDPQLFNTTFSVGPPLLTGYLPASSELFVNGTPAVQHQGAFGLRLQPGVTSLRVVRDGISSTGSLNATGGSVWFIDFSSNVTTLEVTSHGLGSGNSYRFSVGGVSFDLPGAGTTPLTVTQAPLEYSVGTAMTGSSLLLPAVGSGTINATFLPASLSLNFVPVVKNGFVNLTGDVQNGPFWTETLSHSKGYELMAGGGSLGLLNLNTMTFTQGPAENSIIESSVPYENGFLLGGRTSVGATLYFYNITSGGLRNLTSILPPHLQEAYRSSVTTLDLTLNGSAVVMGSGQGVFYIGLLEGFGLRNLTQFVPSSFIGSPGWAGYFGTYVSKYDAEVIVANPNQLGVLFLGNATFSDFSLSVPLDAQSLAHDSTSGYSTWQGMSSNGSVVFMGGVNAASGGGFEALFSPVSGFTDVTGLFPSGMELLTVSWNGRAFVASGVNKSSSTPSVYAYDPSTGAVTKISSGDLKGFQLVDAIDSLSNTMSLVAGFEVTIPPGESYTILTSKYAAFHLDATGVIEGSVSPSTSMVTLGNATVPLIDGSFYEPEFNGSYTLVATAPGYETVSRQLSLSPFSTVELNIALTPTPATTTTGTGVPEFPLQSVAVTAFISLIMVTILVRSKLGRRK